MNHPFHSDAPVPVYRCMRTDGRIHLSGKLDDPRWETAEPIILVDPVTGARAAKRTIVKLLHDGSYLYIGFECEDDYIWGTMRKHDDEIFTEECVEAFLCPSGKSRQYFEINVSPLNTVFDAFIFNGRNPGGGGVREFQTLAAWHCEGLLTRVHVQGGIGEPGARGWTAEFAIPFTSLIGHDHLRPAPGDEWRANFYRIDAPAPRKQVLSAWSPTGAADFHIPWRFGRLVFE